MNTVPSYMHTLIASSVLTPQRAASDELADVVSKIERVIGRDPRRMQIGNITGKLRNFAEYDLVNDLEAAMERYNARMELMQALHRWAYEPRNAEDRAQRRDYVEAALGEVDATRTTAADVIAAIERGDFR